MSGEDTVRTPPILEVAQEYAESLEKEEKLNGELKDIEAEIDKLESLQDHLITKLQGCVSPKERVRVFAIKGMNRVLVVRMHKPIAVKKADKPIQPQGVEITLQEVEGLDE